MTSSGKVGGTSTAAGDTALFRPTQSFGGTEGDPPSVMHNLKGRKWTALGDGSTAAASSELHAGRVDGGSGRPVRSHRRRGEGRGNNPDSASRAPPPPTFPPPHLARRSAQREAEPMGRCDTHF
ncbi:unnamed protein product [Ectocarpus sp. 13 AM-2016]